MIFLKNRLGHGFTPGYPPLILTHLQYWLDLFPVAPAFHGSQLTRHWLYQVMIRFHLKAYLMLEYSSYIII